MLGGDFNCRHKFWGNAENNSEGNKLYSWLCNTIDVHNLKLLKPNNPTCVRANYESFLDLFIIYDNICVQFEPNNNKLTTLDFDSDRKAVVLIIALNNKFVRNGKNATFNWNKGDNTKMNELIDSRLNELHLLISCNIENHQIDAAVAKLNEIFASAIHECVPTIEIKRNKLIKLSHQYQKLLAAKKAARRR